MKDFLTNYRDLIIIGGALAVLSYCVVLYIMYLNGRDEASKGTENYKIRRK